MFNSTFILTWNNAYVNNIEKLLLLFPAFGIIYIE